MRYWKRIDPDNNTTLTAESYSRDLDVEGAIEISKEEYDDFTASLPPIEPVIKRDYGKEIDLINQRLNTLETKPKRVI